METDLCLRLVRKKFSARSTLGVLSIDEAEFSCFVIEDAVRAVKIAGETAIPAGVYEVRLTMSPRFSRVLPELVAVPNYSGVRIHPGNTNRDTEGCLLPASTWELDVRGDYYGRESRRAFAALMLHLGAAHARARRISIEIS